jgi:AcrR family transcriptional regulator
VTTRERILDAALACFTEVGYERTTIARIRERSGVSNGALFHHFPNKDAIAGALYVDAMRSFQQGHWALLEKRPASLAGAIRGLLDHQLRWCEEHPDLARFLYAQGHLDWDSAAGAELSELNRELARAYRDWMRPFVERGELRELPMVLLTAIVAGPAHALAQRWLAGQLRGSLTGYAEALARAATAALTGAPARSPRPRRPANESRVRVQLVGDDGGVVAEGEAVAELTPC